MSFLGADRVQVFAEGLEVEQLSNAAAKVLAPHIEVRLREVVQVRQCSAPRSLAPLHQTCKDVPTQTVPVVCRSACDTDHWNLFPKYLL